MVQLMSFALDLQIIHTRHMTQQLNGVNLGGWLVLEKWITPSLFAGTNAEDEHALMQAAEGSRRIKDHRRTFITEKDFAWMKQNGVNFVRIPVGYWLLESVDGFEPTVKYLDNAMKWAEKYDIHVLIDLHAAQGSQNGQDHGGKRGQAEWFKRHEYQQETTKLLCDIAIRYNNSAALWGIELLNEPKLFGNYFKLLRFYRHTYRELRKVIRPGVYTVFHDGFHAILSSGALRPLKDHPIAMDVHWYAFKSPGGSVQRYLNVLSLYRRALLAYSQFFQPVMVGEWSSVLPERYFTQTPKSQHDELLRQNIAMQQQAYSKALGHAYWNYKHEAGGMWNYRSLVESGTIDLSS